MRCGIIRRKRSVIRVMRIKETAVWIGVHIDTRKLPAWIVHPFADGLIDIAVCLLPPETARAARNRQQQHSQPETLQGPSGCPVTRR